MANNNPQLTQDEGDRLYDLLLRTPLLYRDEWARVTFMHKAGLSHRWVAQYNWHGAPASIAQQLLDAAIQQGIPLVEARKGYTALGCILDQLLRDEMVGQEDGLFVARLIVHRKLIALEDITITVSSRLQELLPIVWAEDAAQQAAEEAAARTAFLADLAARLTQENRQNSGEVVVKVGTQALTLDVDTTGAYYQRGLSYLMQGKHGLAIADFTRAIELVSQEADYYWWRGVSYYSIGNYAETIDDLTHAIELAPQEGKYYLLRGRAYKSMGNRAAARLDFERALELGDPQAAAELRKL